ncbi:hypothetical protein BKA56DRAFT_651656 [Ilyonectria sp. MPI-CAGE-AT-0026]|nr:hypothetical protein BKA56DRAFT_651656 [Ilyonectria sp. MPI-CAGE-AT-0026]
MESVEACWVADTAEDSLCHEEHLDKAQCVIDDKRPRDIQPDKSDPKEVRSRGGEAEEGASRKKNGNDVDVPMVWVLGAHKSHYSRGPCWQQHTAGRASKLAEHHRDTEQAAAGRRRLPKPAKSTPTILMYLTQSSYDTMIRVGISPGIPRTYPETEKHHHHTLYTGANNASANGHPTPISIYYKLRQRQIRLVCLKWPKHSSLVAQCITSAHYENRSITTNKPEGAEITANYHMSAQLELAAMRTEELRVQAEQDIEIILDEAEAPPPPPILQGTDTIDVHTAAIDNMGSSKPRDTIKTKLAAIDAEEMPFMTDETFENLLRRHWN